MKTWKHEAISQENEERTSEETEFSKLQNPESRQFLTCASSLGQARQILFSSISCMMRLELIDGLSYEKCHNIKRVNLLSRERHSVSNTLLRLFHRLNDSQTTSNLKTQ